MAIALDTTIKGSANTATIAHTCTGSNLILFVWMMGRSDTETAHTATYNGVSMTRFATFQQGSNTIRYTLFYLVSPSTGTHNIIVGNNMPAEFYVVSASYTGVSQINFPDSSLDTGSIASGSSRVNTVVSTGCWEISGGMSNNSPFQLSASPLTTRQSNTMSSDTSFVIADSNGTVPTGDYSITYIASGATIIASQFSIAPAPVLAQAGFLFNMI